MVVWLAGIWERDTDRQDPPEASENVLRYKGKRVEKEEKKINHDKQKHKNDHRNKF